MEQEVNNDNEVRLDQFLICGLGSLGQHCITALKKFGVQVIAIEQQVNLNNWEIPNVVELLDDLIIGDCRQNNILQQAKISFCRAALIVTNNERINAETALAIRQLNPHTRLVVRSAKENLNELLSEQLGNFIAYEPTQLPAAAFALAALGNETLGFFHVDGQKLRVVKQKIKQGESWCNKPLYQLNSRTRSVLAHIPSYDAIVNSVQVNSVQLNSVQLNSFHKWEPKEKLVPGDSLIYIETVDHVLATSPEIIYDSRTRQPTIQEIGIKFFNKLKLNLQKFFSLNFQREIGKVALLSALIVFILLVIGTLLFDYYYPETSFLTAFYGTAILLLGGYADLFGDFQATAPIPSWLQIFALSLTVIGTAFVGVLYALLTEKLLSAKFEFTKSRPPIPLKDHMIIVGLGRVGQRVAALLEDFEQSILGISFNADFDRNILPHIPLIIGNVKEALGKANLATAKSIIVVTDDEILNLEIALMARTANPANNLVIRTYGETLTHSLTQILPQASVLGAYAVAAEAFAGAAFGENIISLFRFNHQNILVTEYQIEADDTLHGLLLSEVAYGYGVVNILHQQSGKSSKFMPSDDNILKVGDRLVVLASIKSLRLIEQGLLDTTNKCWQVRIEKALTADAAFEGANAIARISGCHLHVARDLMKQLPQKLSIPLYKHQAERLVKELNKALVKSTLINP